MARPRASPAAPNSLDWRAPEPQHRRHRMPLKPLDRLLAATASTAVLAFAPAAHAGKTLDAVKARGQLVCGVNTSGPGFSSADSQGKWSGLDVDFCRAVAAAVLKDAEKVKFVPLNSQQRFSS